VIAALRRQGLVVQRSSVATLIDPSLSRTRACTDRVEISTLEREDDAYRKDSRGRARCDIAVIEGSWAFSTASKQLARRTRLDCAGIAKLLRAPVSGIDQSPAPHAARPVCSGVAF